MMKNVFAARLRNARKMNGLSFRKLSDRMNGEVTATALQKYEDGKMFPSSTVVISLSRALSVPVDDFFRPFTVSIDPNGISYRKKQSLGKKEEASVNYKSAVQLEKYIEVEKLANEFKSFAFISSVKVESENDASAIAVRFREFFKLGTSPISEPIELLESNGIKIIDVDAPTKFDGNSFSVDGILVIVLNKNFTPERMRFSLFHELGHHVLNIPEGTDDKVEEAYCNAFANEVLMPSEVFKEKIGNYRKDIHINELIALSEMYGISIDALMYKARKLGIINENRCTSYYKRKNFSPEFKELVNRSRYREEKCKRFERLTFKLLANEVISISKCASLLSCSVSDISDMLSY